MSQYGVSIRGSTYDLLKEAARLRGLPISAIVNRVVDSALDDVEGADKIVEPVVIEKGGRGKGNVKSF